MPRVPTVRQADLDRALRALKAQGLGVARIEVRPGGEVVIVPGPLTPAEPPREVSDLERFRAEKAARGGRAT
jgi:hypothetical protein